MLPGLQASALRDDEREFLVAWAWEEGRIEWHRDGRCLGPAHVLARENGLTNPQVLVVIDAVGLKLPVTELLNDVAPPGPVWPWKGRRLETILDEIQSRSTRS